MASWIINSHIINCLVWMNSLHEVVQYVSEKYLVIRIVTVNSRNLSVSIVSTYSSMEGTVDKKYTQIRSSCCHIPGYLRQLILPSLPELWSVLITHSDGGVSGTVEHQHWSLHIWPGSCGTKNTS